MWNSVSQRDHVYLQGARCMDADDWGIKGMETSSTLNRHDPWGSGTSVEPNEWTNALLNCPYFIKTLLHTAGARQIKLLLHRWVAGIRVTYVLTCYNIYNIQIIISIINKWIDILPQPTHIFFLNDILVEYWLDIGVNWGGLSCRPGYSGNGITSQQIR